MESTNSSRMEEGFLDGIRDKATPQKTQVINGIPFKVGYVQPSEDLKRTLETWHKKAEFLESQPASKKIYTHIAEQSKLMHKASNSDPKKNAFQFILCTDVFKQALAMAVIDTSNPDGLVLKHIVKSPYEGKSAGAGEAIIRFLFQSAISNMNAVLVDSPTEELNKYFKDRGFLPSCSKSVPNHMATADRIQGLMIRNNRPFN